MEYTKQPIDFPGQLELLKKRGLIVANDTDALKQLGIISYFRLANYLRPMEDDKQTHSFKPNSTLDNALSLYYFDKELRALIFTAVQSIEIALRTKVIHHVSLKYGAFWFADENLALNKKLAGDNLAHIQKELKRSKEDFIQNHYSKYDAPQYPPVWKTLEVVSFGTLSKLYTNLADVSVKKQIARDFDLPQHIYLESWIASLAVLRNCVAHHARIWNRKYPVKPQMPKKLRKTWISKYDEAPLKLYPQLCIMTYLQNTIHPNNCFAPQLKALLAKYPNVDTRAMGFPATWQNEPLWKCR
jgi:abortive infection bacteriophage resistance protein